MAKAENNVVKSVICTGFVKLELSPLEAVFLKALVSETYGEDNSAEPLSVRMWNALDQAGVPNVNKRIVKDETPIELVDDSMQMVTDAARDFD